MSRWLSFQPRLVAYLGISLDFHLDWRLFAFLLGISLLTSLLFGLVAALRASRTDPGAAMKTGGPGMTQIGGAWEFAARWSLRRSLSPLCCCSSRCC